MHFLRKEHNLNKKLCSIFLRNLTIHMLLGILRSPSGPLLLESKRNLPAWTNQQAPCPLPPASNWIHPMGDTSGGWEEDGKVGFGSLLPSCCRLAEILHL